MCVKVRKRTRVSLQTLNIYPAAHISAVICFLIFYCCFVQLHTHTHRAACGVRWVCVCMLSNFTSRRPLGVTVCKQDIHKVCVCVRLSSDAEKFQPRYRLRAFRALLWCQHFVSPSSLLLFLLSLFSSAAFNQTQPDEIRPETSIAELQQWSCGRGFGRDPEDMKQKNLKKPPVGASNFPRWQYCWKLLN